MCNYFKIRSFFWESVIFTTQGRICFDKAWMSSRYLKEIDSFYFESTVRNITLNCTALWHSFPILEHVFLQDSCHVCINTSDYICRCHILKNHSISRHIYFLILCNYTLPEHPQHDLDFFKKDLARCEE